jgi:hypothetical protein
MCVSFREITSYLLISLVANCYSLRMTSRTSSPVVAASGVVPIEASPPFETAGDEVAPPPDVAPFQVLRPTAATRPQIEPKVWDDPLATLGYPTDHGYVRRFWTAAIGPGAVADLIRLAVAAQRDRSLPRPVSLPQLVREGLCAVEDDTVWVRVTIPPLSRRHVDLLSPKLRREHARHRLEG